MKAWCAYVLADAMKIFTGQCNTMDGTVAANDTYWIGADTNERSSTN